MNYPSPPSRHGASQFCDLPFPTPIVRDNALAAAAAAALLLGALIYLLDRPAGSAWLLPAQWQEAWQSRWPASSASTVRAWAVAAELRACVRLQRAHRAAVSPHRPAFAAAACAGWAFVDTLAEIGQHAAMSQDVAAAVTALLGHGSTAVHIARYFTNGSFASCRYRRRPGGQCGRVRRLVVGRFAAARPCARACARFSWIGR
ncbi:MAG: hypothetical protein U1F67_13855 [Rubrivivax sp.]